MRAACPATAFAKQLARNHLVDTGRGHDTVSASLAFYDANGLASTDHYIMVEAEELGTPAYPYVMQKTPAVLSIRRRCMEEGCTFIWKPRQDLYPITPRV